MLKKLITLFPILLIAGCATTQSTVASSSQPSSEYKCSFGCVTFNSVGINKSTGEKYTGSVSSYIIGGGGVFTIKSDSGVECNGKANKPDVKPAFGKCAGQEGNGSAICSDNSTWNLRWKGHSCALGSGEALSNNGEHIIFVFSKSDSELQLYSERLQSEFNLAKSTRAQSDYSIKDSQNLKQDTQNNVMVSQLVNTIQTPPTDVKEISAKELKILAEQKRIEELKANKEAKRLAEQQRIEQAKLDKQVKEKARLRLAEEKRLAREGDGSPESLICKSFGTKPGTQPYANCRIKLLDKAQQEEQARQQNLHQEWNRRIKDREQEQEQAQAQKEELELAVSRLQAEQMRQYQEQLQIQQSQQVQRDRDAADANDMQALGLILKSLSGVGQPSSVVPTPQIPHFLRGQYYSNGNHMCNYDDGTVINVGAGICPNQR